MRFDFISIKFCESLCASASIARRLAYAQERYAFLLRIFDACSAIPANEMSVVWRSLKNACVLYLCRRHKDTRELNAKCKMQGARCKVQSMKWKMLSWGCLTIRFYHNTREMSIEIQDLRYIFFLYWIFVLHFSRFGDIILDMKEYSRKKGTL